MIARLLVRIIRAYQILLSPDHSWVRFYFPQGCCRFYPTCSMYAKESIARFGVCRGGMKSITRVIRCNPFSSGGIDRAM